jgi:hypothetical protein
MSLRAKCTRPGTAGRQNPSSRGRVAAPFGLVRHRGRPWVSSRREATIGHLLAVTTKLLLGTLEGSLTVFYGIGLALAAPSWWIVAHTAPLIRSQTFEQFSGMDQASEGLSRRTCNRSRGW